MFALKVSDKIECWTSYDTHVSSSGVWGYCKTFQILCFLAAVKVYRISLQIITGSIWSSVIVLWVCGVFKEGISTIRRYYYHWVNHVQRLYALLPVSLPLVIIRPSPYFYSCSASFETANRL